MATWNLTKTSHHILVCNGSSCKRAGAEELTQAIRAEITDRGLDRQLHTSRTLCNGRCHDKCVVIAYPNGDWYKEMSSDDASSFVDSIISGKRLTGKLSHTYEAGSFHPTEGTELGKEKNDEIVKKVSKKL